MKQYKYGLALSGGGAKGLAHIGVLQALEDLNMRPEIVSGVSAGAIIGALYADGLTPREILKVFQNSSFIKFINLRSPRRAILSADKFYKTIEKFLHAKSFEELSLPLYINATNLTDGKIEYFNSGSLLDKIVASSSVPIALSPQIIDGKMYVDGGIFCNIPCEIIRDKCETLIGVHVNPITQMEDADNIIDVFERVYHLLIQANTVSQKEICDVVIEPIEAKSFGMFEVSKSEELFDVGYQAAMKQLEQYK